MFKFLVAAASVVLVSAWTDEPHCMDHFTADGDAQGVFLTGALSQGAMALDGTPQVYYIEKGTGDGVNSWYIHHQGGGWCESPTDCLDRSTTSLGSSKGFPATANLGGGYFSSDPAENPLMATWNKVFIRYLDGGSFSGDLEAPYKVGDKTIYFRGHRNLHAVMDDLFAHQNLGAGQNFMISGCSAGGLATYLHTDEWRERILAVNPKAKVRALPDSGFFLDVQLVTPPNPPMSGRALTTVPGNYHAGLVWVHETMNTTGGLNADCVKDKLPSKKEWMCQFAEHTCPYLSTPTFPMQSEYDAWQVGHVLPADHTDATIQEMGNNITTRVQTLLLNSKKPASPHGIFLDSCQHHCGAWNSINIDGDLVSVAIQKWWENPETKSAWIQGAKYPCTSCCKP